VVSFTPRPLYPQGKSPWYPLDRKLGGPQSRSGRGGEEKNSQPPPGIVPKNPDHVAHIPTLYRLSYRGSGRRYYNINLDLREVECGWNGVGIISSGVQSAGFATRMLSLKTAITVTSSSFKD
jgi:hypothetical protein